MSEPVRKIDHTLIVPFKWSYGESLTRFFHETKTNRRIVGARCTKCRSVVIPCLSRCGRCFAPCEKDPVPVSDKGTVECWTTIRFSFPCQPAEPPYTVGLIILDGANTYFQHLIKEVEPEDMKPDMRVEAVWNPDPKGNLLDIMYFRPLKK